MCSFPPPAAAHFRGVFTADVYCRDDLATHSFRRWLQCFPQVENSFFGGLRPQNPTLGSQL